MDVNHFNKKDRTPYFDIRYSLFDIRYSLFLRVFSSIKLAAFQAVGDPEACELQTGKKRRMACASFRYYQLSTL
jgi:hypothetical protein